MPKPKIVAGANTVGAEVIDVPRTGGAVRSLAEKRLGRAHENQVDADALRAQFFEHVGTLTFNRITFTARSSSEANIAGAGKVQEALPDGYLVHVPEPKKPLFGGPEKHQANLYKQNLTLTRALREMLRGLEVDGQSAVHHTAEGVWISEEAITLLSEKYAYQLSRFKDDEGREVPGAMREATANISTMTNLRTQCDVLLAKVRENGRGVG